LYHAAGTAGVTDAPALTAYPTSLDVLDAATVAGLLVELETEVVEVARTDRRKNAQKRPSCVVVIDTTSQPSADLRVSSAARPSGLALNGLNAAYSNMKRRLSLPRSLGEVMNARRVGYFGPAGTFTEQALLTQPDLAKMQLVPYRTVPDVLDAVESGEVNLGFVPIENSIEGTVNFTQDALVFDHDLLIQREVVLDIEHCVLARPGTTLENVKVLLSIPVATAQCHVFVRNSLPRAEVRAANSTAEAARLVSEDSSNTLAAIAPENAARIYGLEVLRRNVADHEGNQTRFILVGKDRIPARTGNDKTGLVVFQRADEPGSLIGILQEFAARRINLSQLLSRPTKRGGLGDYCFVIYADAHVSDEVMADALRDLRTKQGDVKFLGSYPNASPQPASVREHADQRWRDADDWLRDIRSRIDG
jgi:prephenate dehydratase